MLLSVQVFVALLRISQPDGRRAVVRQALDVLTPALVKRLPQGENRYPIWIRSAAFTMVGFHACPPMPRCACAQ